MDKPDTLVRSHPAPDHVAVIEGFTALDDGGLSALLVGALTRLIPLDSPVSLYLAQQAETIAQLDFHRALTISAVAAWAVWLAFLALAVSMARAGRGREKKTSGKNRRSVL